MAPPTGVCDYQLGARLCVSDGVLSKALIHAVIRVEQSENFEVVTVDDLEVLAGNEDVSILDPAHCRLRHAVDVALELHFALRVRILVTWALTECRWHCWEEMVAKSRSVHSFNVFILLLNNLGLNQHVSHYATLRYATLRYATLRYATLRYATLRYSTLLYSTLHYTTLHYTTLHYTTLHYTTLLYTRLD